METCWGRGMAATRTESIDTHPTAELGISSSASARTWGVCQQWGEMVLAFPLICTRNCFGRWSPQPSSFIWVFPLSQFQPPLRKLWGVNSKDASVLLPDRKGGNWAMCFLGNCNNTPVPGFVCGYPHQAVRHMYCRTANENAAEIPRSRILHCACTACIWLHAKQHQCGILRNVLWRAALQESGQYTTLKLVYKLSCFVRIWVLPTFSPVSGVNCALCEPPGYHLSVQWPSKVKKLLVSDVREEEMQIPDLKDKIQCMLKEICLLAASSLYSQERPELFSLLLEKVKWSGWWRGKETSASRRGFPYTLFIPQE